jgi:hypothetical protein
MFLIDGRGLRVAKYLKIGSSFHFSLYLCLCPKCICRRVCTKTVFLESRICVC